MSGYGSGPLADLDPTEAELHALDAVLAEIRDGDLDDDGLLDDEAALAAEMSRLNAELGAYDLSGDELETAIELAASGAALDELDELALINAQLEDNAAAGAQRLAEDALGMPLDTEERTAHLLDRIERGTYLPPQPAYDDTLGNCGPRDDLGYCTARYHDAGCMSVLAGEAANGSAESALAWRAQLLSNHQAVTALQLASEQQDAQTPYDEQPHDLATLGAMRGILGITGR